MFFQCHDFNPTKRYSDADDGLLRQVPWGHTSLHLFSLKVKGRTSNGSWKHHHDKYDKKGLKFPENHHHSTSWTTSYRTQKKFHIIKHHFFHIFPIKAIIFPYETSLKVMVFIGPPRQKSLDQLQGNEPLRDGQLCTDAAKHLTHSAQGPRDPGRIGTQQG